MKYGRCSGLLLCVLVAGACGLSGPRASSDDDDGGNGGSQSAGTASAQGGGGSSNSSSGTVDPAGTGGSGAGSGGSGAGDPDCYVEPLDGMANVDDIVSSYGGAGYKQDVIEAMARRWPAGAYLLTEQINDSYFAQFSDPSSWTGMVNWLDTLVHEETHLFNANHAISNGQAHALYFREDLIVYLPQEQGFPRSEILSQLIPQAQSGTYATTYLTGTQGQRAFNPLLDEATCYANEVPGLAAFGQYFNGGVSLRDGSAALLYFIEVYLRVARTNHPQFHEYVKNSPAYVEALQILWLRTHYFYQLADQYPSLGIDDDLYRSEAYKPANIAEIEMVIGRKLGASNCFLD